MRSWLAFIALLAGGCGTDERNDLCSDMPQLWQSSDFEAFQLRCELVPELCGLTVDSEIREPDLYLAIDVVFVGDGYTETSIASYRDRVRALIVSLAP